MADVANVNYVSKKERLAFYFSAALRDMSYALVGGYLMLFYIDIMGFAGTAALIFIPIITRIWDGINDPLMGAYYDRQKYTTEKAHPIFKKTALLAAVLLICMFYAPKFSDNARIDYIIKVIYAIITYCIFEALQTVNGTAFMSLYNSISSNPDERTKIISISRLFSTAGTAIIGGGIPVLLGLFRNDDIAAKTYVFLGVACFVALCFVIYNFLMYNFVKERMVTPPPKKQKILPMLKRFTKNKPLLLMIAGNCIMNFVNLGAIQLYFYTYNMGSPALQTVIAIFTMPTFILGTLLVPHLVKRFNKRNIVMVCSAFLVVSNIIYLFAGYKPELWMVMTILFVNNIPSSIKSALYWNMVADSVDYAEWKTGYRNDGLVYSIEGCASKIVGAIGAMSIGIVITAINFVPNALEQSEKTMKGLFYIPLIISIIATSLSIIPYFFYKLDRKQHEMILEELKAKRILADTAAQVSEEQ